MTDKTGTNQRHIVRVTVIIITCIVTGWLYMFCAKVLYENTANKHWKSRRYHARKDNPRNHLMADSCAALLQTGDLVVRRGDDMTSYMLSQLNATDKTYSHCGLVIIEDGTPYVYHSIGGEDNPDQVLKKDPVALWFAPANNLAIAAYRYNMPDSTIERLKSKVREYYVQKKMFDMAFDLDTDERLYCSEMICKAIYAATGDTTYIRQANAYGRSFVGVDNLYLTPHAKRICQVRYK